MHPSPTYPAPKVPNSGGSGTCKQFFGGYEDVSHCNSEQELFYRRSVPTIVSSPYHRRQKSWESTVISGKYVQKNMQSSSSNYLPYLADPLEPHRNDVLLGRGGKNNQWTGNEQLRELARKQAREYIVSSKKEKSAISRLLVKQMHELSPQARFLKRVQNSHGWEEVKDAAAREKASQVLRDAVAVLDVKSDSSGKLAASADTILHVQEDEVTVYPVPIVSIDVARHKHSNVAIQPSTSLSSNSESTTATASGAVRQSPRRHQSAPFSTSKRRRTSSGQSTFQFQNERHSGHRHPEHKNMPVPVDRVASQSFSPIRRHSDGTPSRSHDHGNMAREDSGRIDQPHAPLHYQHPQYNYQNERPHHYHGRPGVYSHSGEYVPYDYYHPNAQYGQERDHHGFSQQHQSHQYDRPQQHYSRSNFYDAMPQHNSYPAADPPPPVSSTAPTPPEFIYDDAKPKFVERGLKRSSSKTAAVNVAVAPTADNPVAQNRDEKCRRRSSMGNFSTGTSEFDLLIGDLLESDSE